MVIIGLNMNFFRSSCFLCYIQMLQNKNIDRIIGKKQTIPCLFYITILVVLFIFSILRSNCNSVDKNYM